MFPVKHNTILLFNLLDTSNGHYTVIRPSVHKTYNSAQQIKCRIESHKPYTSVKILLKLSIILPVM